MEPSVPISCLKFPVRGANPAGFANTRLPSFRRNPTTREPCHHPVLTLRKRRVADFPPRSDRAAASVSTGLSPEQMWTAGCGRLLPHPQAAGRPSGWSPCQTGGNEEKWWIGEGRLSGGRSPEALRPISFAFATNAHGPSGFRQQILVYLCRHADATSGKVGHSIVHRAAEHLRRLRQGECVILL